MNIELLKEQLQESLLSFFYGQLDQDTLDLMCSVIINTINDVELL